MFIDKYLVDSFDYSLYQCVKVVHYTTLACGTYFGKWTYYAIPSDEWDNWEISDKIFADLDVLFPLEEGYIWEWHLWNGQFESRTKEDYQ